MFNSGALRTDRFSNTDGLPPVPATTSKGKPMNPAPILTVEGTAHSVRRVPVEAFEGRPEQRDENGNLLRQAQAPRAAYETTEVTVLTADGGFCTVTIMDAELRELGGEIPDAGKPVSFAVRTFVRWERYGTRSVPRVGYSVAGDITAKRASSGKRAHLAPTGS